MDLFQINGDTGGNDVGNCTDDDVFLNAFFNNPGTVLINCPMNVVLEQLEEMEQ